MLPVVWNLSLCYDRFEERLKFLFSSTQAVEWYPVTCSFDIHRGTEAWKVCVLLLLLLFSIGGNKVPRTGKRSNSRRMGEHEEKEKEKERERRRGKERERGRREGEDEGKQKREEKGRR